MSESLVLAGDIRGTKSNLAFFRVAASEGGHADFAPRNEEEVALWRSLAARYGRVSVERVVSGQGLVSTHAFLRDRGAASRALSVA